MPVGIAVALAAPRYLLESKVEGGTRSFDLLGAVLATGGMSLLVYGLVQTVDHSWSAPRTIGLFVAAALMLVGFIATERRVSAPLMPWASSVTAR